MALFRHFVFGGSVVAMNPAHIVSWTYDASEPRLDVRLVQGHEVYFHDEARVMVAWLLEQSQEVPLPAPLAEE